MGRPLILNLVNPFSAKFFYIIFIVLNLSYLEWFAEFLKGFS